MKMKSWKDVPNDLFRSVMAQIQNDGHSIFDSAAFTSIGVPEELLPIYNHQSGSSHKETIYTERGIAAFMKGVYSLDLLNRIVRDLGLQDKCVSFRGRGFQAQDRTRVINNYLNTSLTHSVEQGVADVLNRNTVELKDGQNLSDITGK